MDEEYREPSWRGVIITLVATVVLVAGAVLLVSYLLQQNCPPGSTAFGCSPPAINAEPGAGEE
ncbi:MAG TPA: hypothetical protein VIC63_07955 [Candidatus Limnocylindria bacterium]|jgi:hypothetical protein